MLARIVERETDVAKAGHLYFMFENYFLYNIPVTMPFRRKYGGRKKVVRRRVAGGRPYRKKRFQKRRFAGSSGVPRGPNSVGFPQRMFKTFTFSLGSQKLQQVTVDLPVSYIFRGNSMFDPDQSGIGNQPRWYDTFMGASGGAAPYRTCTVLGSKISVQIWQDPVLGGATGSVAGVVSVIPYVNGSTVASSLKEIMERAFVKWRNVGNANSSRPLVLKHFAKTKGLYQGANPLNDMDNFSHDYNGNPNKQWYWAVQAVNVIDGGPGVNLFSCYVAVRIKYYVMLSQLNDVANS